MLLVVDFPCALCASRGFTFNRNPRQRNESRCHARLYSSRLKRSMNTRGPAKERERGTKGEVAPCVSGAREGSGWPGPCILSSPIFCLVPRRGCGSITLPALIISPPARPRELPGGGVADVKVGVGVAAAGLCVCLAVWGPSHHLRSPMRGRMRNAK